MGAHSTGLIAAVRARWDERRERTAALPLLSPTRLEQLRSPVKAPRANPSPSELQWRIDWMAGLRRTPLPPPPPTASEPPRTALRVRIRQELARSLAEEALRVEERARREVAAVFGTPPAQVGRLRASMRHDVAPAVHPAT